MKRIVDTYYEWNLSRWVEDHPTEKPVTFKIDGTEIRVNMVTFRQEKTETHMLLDVQWRSGIEWLSLWPEMQTEAGKKRIEQLIRRIDKVMAETCHMNLLYNGLGKCDAIGRGVYYWFKIPKGTQAHKLVLQAFHDLTIAWGRPKLLEQTMFWLDICQRTRIVIDTHRTMGYSEHVVREHLNLPRD